MRSTHKLDLLNETPELSFHFGGSKLGYEFNLKRME